MPAVAPAGSDHGARRAPAGETLAAVANIVLAVPRTTENLPALRELAGAVSAYVADLGATIEQAQPPRPVGDLQLPPPGDASELLVNRYLCRGGSMLLVGPSGIGKSSFLMQAAVCWSVGRPAFGLLPARPLRVLLIQAENDDGDLAEMRDGVLKGLAEELTQAQCSQAAQAVAVMHVTTVVGDRVGDLLRKHAMGFDLVILDPLFSYIGGDVMKARDVSHFLREVLQPVLVELGIGLLVAHHTNKPPRGAEAETWQAGDFAYLGAGSAELTNWPRGVLAIRSIGSESVFELRAAKRGKRLGWRDAEGHATTVRLIGHSEHGICWRDVSGEEAADLLAKSGGAGGTPAGRRDRDHAEDIERAVGIASRQAWRKSGLKSAIVQDLAVSPSYCDRQILPDLREHPGLAEATARLGKQPVYLLGPAALVKAEKERLESDYARKAAGE